MDKDKSEVFKSFTNKAIKRFQEKRSENTAHYIFRAWMKILKSATWIILKS